MNNRQSLFGGGRHSENFYDVISIEELFKAWKVFRKGKRSKTDVAHFELNLEDNIFRLHNEIVSGNWKPDPYIEFYVQDPKLRKIHKASVRDRVLYQAIYKKLYPLFNSTFIHDSYASRNLKGTHRGVERFDEFARKSTNNYRNGAFVLKCDIRKFFDSIDHTILLDLIKRKCEEKLVVLIEKIIQSFEHSSGKGLPLGNVTSQICANIYMNELDQFVKHKLKAKYYIRYCDDFVILDTNKKILEENMTKISSFLKTQLSLELHPTKVSIKKISQGTDFLGYVSLPHYRVLRTSTRKRMLKRVNKENLPSYLGILQHCRGEKLRRILLTNTQDCASSCDGITYSYGSNPPSNPTEFRINQKNFRRH